MTCNATRGAMALLAVLGAAHCKKNRGTEGLGAVVDRSDGTLPALNAPRVADGAIRIDGKLDEPAWAGAGQTGAFVGPGDGKPESRSRVNASARVAWDSKRVYLGVTVNDPEPSSPFGEGDTDPHVWERSSAVEWMIQPGDFGDNRDYFEVQVDVNRAVWDTHFDDYNNPIYETPTGRRFGHQEWKSDVERAVVIDRANNRYFLELAIPLSALATARVPGGVPGPGDVWRMNFYSFRDGQRDSLAWSPLLGQGNFHRAQRFGRVRFTQSQ